jgi:hypothetical protein
MKYDAYSLPMRTTSSGDQIETRPLYVEEWLDALPYIDFKKTSQLLYEATRATNEQTLKPAIRLELVELYNRPYQYYIDSQIKAGAQHTLQSIDTMQEQIQVLKRIAINLGLACKISADETLKLKTLWGQSRPPLLNLLHSLNYLSHALIFSFIEYAPTPKNIWREINFIYDFAESLGQQNTSLLTLKTPSLNHTTTIAQAYNRICLAALADPHHLPYGAIWEIYEQLNSWAGLVKIIPFKKPSDPSGLFVIKLDSDSSPLAYGKFNTASAGDKHRLLDATGLIKQIDTNLTALGKGGAADKSLTISPYFAKLILGHMARVWGTPPKRVNQRQDRTGTIELACGLNAAWYLLNNEREFIEPVIASPDTEDAHDHSSHKDLDTTPVENYRVDQWNLVDQSARGFAVIKNDRPTYNIRVGDLIVISIKGQSGKWALGTIRWLMIRQGQIYKIGVQLLSTRAKPVAVRATSGSASDTRYRRALLIPDLNDNEPSLITSKGLFISNRDLELVDGPVFSKARALSILESTAGFEQFLLGSPR